MFDDIKHEEIPIDVTFRSGGFQQYFSHIVAVSFIGGGKRSTWSRIRTHNFSGDRQIAYR